MHLRRKAPTGPRAIVDHIADAARSSDLADQASDMTSKVAANVAKKSADLGKRSAVLGSELGDRLGDVAHIASEEGRALMEHHGKHEHRGKVLRPKRSRRHRLRHAAMFAGAGAVAAYFFDPDNGTERRAAAQRRTSNSAQVVGDGLDRAAHLAHQASEAAH